MGILNKEEQKRKFTGASNKEAGKAINEIRRREIAVNKMRANDGGNSVMDKGKDGGHSASGDDSENLQALLGVDFCNTEQKYVLVGLTSKKTPPYSDEAGICICGVFSSLVEAEHQQVQLAKESNIKLTTVPFIAQTFVPICANHKKQTDENYLIKKRKQILDSYNLYIQTNKKEFDENKEKHRAGKTDLDIKNLRTKKIVKKTTTREAAIKAYNLRNGINLDPVTPETKDGTSDTTATDSTTDSTVNGPNNKGVFRFPRSCEVRGQMFAAVIFISDKNYQNRKPNPTGYVEEPLFLFLQAFDTEDKCIKYIKKFSKKSEIKDYHVDCVSMYELLYPKDVDRHGDKIRKEWRGGDQNAIMNNIEVQKNLVESFKDYCSSEGIVAPITEVTRDGTVTSIDMHGTVTEGGSAPGMVLGNGDGSGSLIPKYVKDSDINPV